MIRTIRSARVNLKTGILILVLALLMWALVTYVRIRDFVPEEFTEQADSSARTP